MERICQHCAAPFDGSAYRVKSEEAGVVLLNMIVCHYCYEQAQKLSLYTEEAGPNPELSVHHEMKSEAGWVST
jgi:hypothetical protein